ncbi:MAG: hypothetical protein KIT09_24190 [Bryobacteraceae bacterium]|nr:hypothetical protein [Bryobacteraceae bacterium]
MPAAHCDGNKARELWASLVEAGWKQLNGYLNKAADLESRLERLARSVIGAGSV